MVQRPLRLPTKSTRAQAESKALFNRTRSTDAADFFTFGYSRRSVQDLIELLCAVQVRSIVDIRVSPVSIFRPELSKSNFRRLVEEAGFRYCHFPKLGVPREVRARAIAAGNREVIWTWYDKHVIEPFLKLSLTEFLKLEQPVAFMCVEADPRECHRHRLLEALEARGYSGFDL